jgi:hypothetical protein
LLVSLSTTIKGGVSYRKRTTEAEQVIGNTAVASWETTRTVADVEDHAKAVVARGKARNAITRVCSATSFGLMCPQSDEGALTQGIALARAFAADHNSVATSTRVDVYVIVGRVAATDQEAIASIGFETRNILEAMERAVRAADPQAIREAADKARELSGILTPDASEKVSAAIAEVRKIARDVVRRVGKAGETAASVVDGLKLEALQSARFAVLDLLGESESIDIEPIAEAGRAVDFEPIGDTEAIRAPAVEIEV